MKIKSGTEVLIKAIIVRQTLDSKPQKGYLVATTRGKVYVDSQDVLPLKNKKKC